MKLPWQYVSVEMDKLYEKEFDSKDLKAIDKHCDFIVSFLHACGWNEEEYISALFGVSLSDDTETNISVN